MLKVKLYSATKKYLTNTNNQDTRNKVIEVIKSYLHFYLSKHVLLTERNLVDTVINELNNLSIDGDTLTIGEERIQLDENLIYLNELHKLLNDSIKEVLYQSEPKDMVTLGDYNYNTSLTEEQLGKLDQVNQLAERMAIEQVIPLQHVYLILVNNFAIDSILSSRTLLNILDKEISDIEQSIVNHPIYNLLRNLSSHFDYINLYRTTTNYNTYNLSLSTTIKLDYVDVKYHLMVTHVKDVETSSTLSLSVYNSKLHFLDNQNNPIDLPSAIKLQEIVGEILHNENPMKDYLIGETIEEIKQELNGENLSKYFELIKLLHSRSMGTSNILNNFKSILIKEYSNTIYLNSLLSTVPEDVSIVIKDDNYIFNLDNYLFYVHKDEPKLNSYLSNFLDFMNNIYLKKPTKDYAVPMLNTLMNLSIIDELSEETEFGKAINLLNFPYNINYGIYLEKHLLLNVDHLGLKLCIYNSNNLDLVTSYTYKIDELDELSEVVKELLD